MWILSLCLLLAVDCRAQSEYQNAMYERESLINNGINSMLGHDIMLTESEQKANEIIMLLKLQALEEGFKNPGLFNVSKHFFEYKDAVKETELFKIIHKMPKGAILHAHDQGMLKPEYVLNITYCDNLYVCFENKDTQFIFSISTPTVTCQTKWELMWDARQKSLNVKEFDKRIRNLFTIVTDKPQQVYTDVNIAWNKFNQYFINSGSLLTYKPIWDQYFYDTLLSFRDDNIMYAEIRSVLPQLYDLEGNVYDSIATAMSYKQVLDRFVKDYPDFLGAKLIYAPVRKVDSKTVKNYLNIAKELKAKLPDFLAGFDLVGQEDVGSPLKDFLPELVEAKNDLNYFFHAGETNWYGTSSDENLIDAVVLGAKRLGHAYALAKHPYLMKEIVQRGIAIEVNVVSNNVLKLVDDVRNHPLAAFLAQDLPVVISSDDPGVWEADPISHDFYVTFLGVASRHADLKLLKKLALNSLYYSSVEDKENILHEFEIRWANFIASIIVKDKSYNPWSFARLLQWILTCK